MPTIAELIASKNRKSPPAKVVEEDPELEEAISRIDLPKRKPLVLGTSIDKGRMEPSPDIPQAADDMDMVVYQDKDGLWLAMPCTSPHLAPIKILRLPWRLHSSTPYSVGEGDPF